MYAIRSYYATALDVEPLRTWIPSLFVFPASGMFPALPTSGHESMFIVSPQVFPVTLFPVPMWNSPLFSMNIAPCTAVLPVIVCRITSYNVCYTKLLR